MNARLAVPADAADLARLNAEFNEGSKVTPQQMATQLAAGPAIETVLVAEVDGHAVGFACLQMRRSICYTETWFELAELYVEPSCRRRGLGRRLVGLAERVAREHGASQVTLLVNKANAAAQEFYHAMGYALRGDHVMVKRM